MTFPGSKGCFEDRRNSLGLTVLCNRPQTGRATETFFSRNRNLWASSELKWRKASINILTLVIESSVGAIMDSARTQHANTLYRNKEEVPDMTNTHQPRFYSLRPFLSLRSPYLPVRTEILAVELIFFQLQWTGAAAGPPGIRRRAMADITRQPWLMAALVVIVSSHALPVDSLSSPDLQPYTVSWIMLSNANFISRICVGNTENEPQR